MHSSNRQHRDGKLGLFGLSILAFACLLLLTLLTLVQVAHVHPASTGADHCPLCVVMHSVAPAVLVAAAILTSRSSEPIPVPVVSYAPRSWRSYKLYNRPPPSQV